MYEHPEEKHLLPEGAKMMYMQKKVERDEGPIVG